MKVLILGGYGTFGGRLIELVKNEARLEILVAGRSLAKAEAFCAGLTGAARLRPLVADRAGIGPVLAAEQPDVVVDASGPFQAYGDDPYVVPRACVAAGADYLDLADGAEFVDGIGALDAEAKAAGRFVLAGVSSFPVLTAAVLTEMAREMDVVSVRAGIAPSPFAGVGRNVLKAVLGYGGRPVGVLEDGRRVGRPALVSSWRATVAVPGRVPLRRLRFSLVDVPDLKALPPVFPGLRDLWIGAAPQPPFWHAMLSLLAATRLPGLVRLVPLAELVLNRFTWGEDRGGMLIEAVGAGGRRIGWHLLAEAGDGPLIPSMPAAGIIRMMLDRRRPAAGARSGIGEVTLADYGRLFEGRDIHTGWRHRAGGSLYHELLGEAFGTLPAPVRALHQPGERAVWTGLADIARAPGWAAGLVARLFGFPAGGRDVPVHVTFTTDAEGRETWERRFGKGLMRSTQEAGRGAWEHLMVERFGPFAFALAVVADGDHLRLVPRGWRFLGIPLPRRLMPGGPAWETAEGDRFRFHVEIAVPLVGPVVRYEGWLRPAG